MNKTIINTMAEGIRPASRNRFIIYLALFLGVIFMVPGVIASIAGASPVVGFNAGRIIDDGVFTNSNSMNVGQIQAFLNSKVPTCDTWHAPGYGQNPPFTCLKDFSENGRSAAQIIYDMSQQYQINPQVLIVLLQKEQGLVTDTWPLASQYRSATGYGCPDTAACDSTYYGFTNQVTWAAKMFRAILNNSPTWYSPYVLGNNDILWSPNRTCGSSTVNIQNLSTVALYDYTPYRPNQAALDAGYGQGDSCSAHGNRNFYLYFTEWFGSTQFPQPIGALIQQSLSTGAIYLVDSSTATPTRYAVPDWQTMQNYGLDAYPAMSVSNSSLEAMTDGGMLTSLVWDGSSVYFVNNQTRYPVTLDMCTSWGFSCSDGAYVKSLPMDFQTQYLKQGATLTSLMYYNGVAYKMSSGEKQPFANNKTLSDLGFTNTSYLVASPVNAGQKLGKLLLTTPGVVKFNPNSTLYYFDGINYFSVGDMDVYNDWSLSRQPTLQVPTSSYNGTESPTSTPLSVWYQDAVSGQKYAIDKGIKVSIPLSLQGVFSQVPFSSSNKPMADTLPTTVLKNFVSLSPAIYVLSGDKAHYVPTLQDISSLGINDQNISSLRPSKLTLMSKGSDALGNGRLVKIINDNTIYVVSNSKLLPINDISILGAYGFNWQNIALYSQQNIADYAVAPTYLARSVKDAGTGNFYYVYNGAKITVTGAQVDDFGVIVNKYQTIDDDMKPLLPPSQIGISRFLKNSDDGAIYYASGGALHYITSLDAFYAYGGSGSLITSVDSAFIHTFVIAQPI